MYEVAVERGAGSAAVDPQGQKRPISQALQVTHPAKVCRTADAGTERRTGGVLLGVSVHKGEDELSLGVCVHKGEDEVSGWLGHGRKALTLSVVQGVLDVDECLALCE